MNEIRFTDTNAADDSGGSVWGLEGNLFLPIVAASALSIGILLLLFSLLKVHWLPSLLVALIPFLGTLAYVLLFKQGKPPGYDRDLYELWVLGKGFALNPLDQDAFDRPEREDA